MRLKKLLASLGAACVIASSFAVPAHAEYITAFEEYDKYVVDTDSFFYPDKKDPYHRFNCMVWRYTDAENTQKKPYTFQFKFEKNKWYFLEKVSEDKYEWTVAEDRSIASDILRVCMPFLGKTNVIDKSQYR